jgi:ferritin
MISDKINSALNEQANKEFFSSYLYLSMSTYFDSNNWKGMATWMKFQAQEELMHALKFLAYIEESGGRVKLNQLETPQHEWESPTAVYNDAYNHECFISKSINEIVDLALAEKDHATHNMLQWFVTEQVEEESAAQEILEKLKLVGDNGVALFMIDKELSARPAPTPPAAAG